MYQYEKIQNNSQEKSILVQIKHSKIICIYSWKILNDLR